MTSLQTPLYNLSEFPLVYEPAEDTHLFLDALEKDMDNFLQIKPVTICEIGCGSGILITALASIFKNTCCYFCTDINPQACLATKNTALLNKADIECVQMDLTSCLKAQWRFDVIIFNPPYVVTEENEIKGNGLNRAFAGGKKGRIITDKFLKSLVNILSDNGVCYVLFLKDNILVEVEKIMQQNGFCSTVIMERKIPGEHLYICKFNKKH